MLKRLAIIFSLAVLAFAGPSYGKSLADQPVRVTVKDGVISADPDPVKMAKNSKKITWVLATPGFTFPANGIVIKDADGEYGDCGIQVSKRKKADKDTEFVCRKLKHIGKKEYKYDVNLINGSTGKPMVLDPTIQNE